MQPENDSTDGAVQRTSWTPPWSILPGWTIASMNHYRIGGELLLFVGMTKGNLYIKAEGKDDEHLWNRLWHCAQSLEGRVPPKHP